MEVCSHFEHFRAVLFKKVMVFFERFLARKQSGLLTCFGYTWGRKVVKMGFLTKLLQQKAVVEIFIFAENPHFWCGVAEKYFFRVNKVLMRLQKLFCSKKVLGGTTDSSEWNLVHFGPKNDHFRPKIENLKSEIGRNFGHWGPTPPQKFFLSPDTQNLWPNFFFGF